MRSSQLSACPLALKLVWGSERTGAKRDQHSLMPFLTFNPKLDEAAFEPRIIGLAWLWEDEDVGSFGRVRRPRMHKGYGVFDPSRERRYQERSVLA